MSYVHKVLRCQSLWPLESTIAVLAMLKANGGLEVGVRGAWTVSLGTLACPCSLGSSLPRLLSTQIRGGSQILPWGEGSDAVVKSAGSEVSPLDPQLALSLPSYRTPQGAVSSSARGRARGRIGAAGRLL